MGGHERLQLGQGCSAKMQHVTVIGLHKGRDGTVAHLHI